MDENEVNIYNLAIETYTDLLFKIIETAYARGYANAIKEIEWAALQQAEQEQQQVQEVVRKPVQQQIPVQQQTIQQPKEESTQPKSFSDRLKSIRR